MQLKAAPYLGGMHSISLGHYYGKRPCQLSACKSRSQTNDRGLWFGNETTVCIRTTFENGALRNGLSQPVL